MKVVIERHQVVVVETLPVGWIVRCAMCKGSAIKPGYNETSCPSCDGVGKRRLLLPDDADTSVDWGRYSVAIAREQASSPNTTKRSALFAMVVAFKRAHSRESCAASAREVVSSQATMKRLATVKVARVVGQFTLATFNNEAPNNSMQRTALHTAAEPER